MNLAVLGCTNTFNRQVLVARASPGISTVDVDVEIVTMMKSHVEALTLRHGDASPWGMHRRILR